MEVQFAGDYFIFMKTKRFAVLTALALPGFFHSASAANIASEGIPIAGVATGINSEHGVIWFQSGTLGNLVDGDPSTRLDTWNGNQPQADTHRYGFAGVIWGAPRTDLITEVTVTLATFGDGGWFGVSGAGPDAGGALTAEMLVEPTLQVLGAEGWVNVSVTSNYLPQMTGHLIGGGGVPNPSSREFTLVPTQPLTGVSGLRVIGPEGGTASNGFVGFFELSVQASPVPEPSAALLAGVCGALGFGARKRRR